jgi:hypothetical protein
MNACVLSGMAAFLVGLYSLECHAPASGVLMLLSLGLAIWSGIRWERYRDKEGHP